VIYEALTLLCGGSLVAYYCLLIREHCHGEMTPSAMLRKFQLTWISRCQLSNEIKCLFVYFLSRNWTSKNFFSFFAWYWILNSGPSFSRQVLYHLSHTLSTFLIWRAMCLDCDSPIYASRVAGTTGAPTMPSYFLLLEWGLVSLFQGWPPTTIILISTHPHSPAASNTSLSCLTLLQVFAFKVSISSLLYYK
jgi:hypothetical protein